MSATWSHAQEVLCPGFAHTRTQGEGQDVITQDLGAQAIAPHSSAIILLSSPEILSHHTHNWHSHLTHNWSAHLRDSTHRKGRRRCDHSSDRDNNSFPLSRVQDDSPIQLKDGQRGATSII